MPREGITIYDLLISCPGDVNSYLGILKDSVENFNRTFGASNNIEVVTKHWSTDSYPESGNRAQELLNKQFVRGCDAAVVIFWTRFGTPTDKFGSGTEEEIEEMLSADKQVFMYFLDAPVNPSEVDMGQYQKVIDFKEKYKDRGVFGVIKDEHDFQRQFSNHLAMYFRSLTSGTVQESKEELQPNLILKDFDTFSDKFFTPKKSLLLESEFIYKKKEEIIDEIRFLENSVLPKRGNEELRNVESDSVVKSNKPVNPDFSSLNIDVKSLRSNITDVEIDVSWKNTINDFAIKNNIELDDDFWNLGNLQSYVVNFNVPFGNKGKSFLGTDLEKNRFKSIKNLFTKVKKYIEYCDYFQCIDGIEQVRFMISNSGKKYDEDIDVKLKVPKGCLLKHQEIPFPGLNIIEHLIDINFPDYVFSIKETETVSEYSYSKTEHLNFNNIPSPNLFFQKSISDKYEENKNNYLDSLDSLFSYKVFDSSEFDVLVLHIEYLKHNSSMAFPSVLMFKNIPEAITYEITSKYLPDVVQGNIKLEKRDS